MAQTVSSAARPFRFERKTPTKYYVVDHKGARPAPGLNGRIEFRDVAFEYVPGQPVLSDINLTIEPGERIALVGATGAGKSTFVSLIPRFYDPTRGAVCADEFIQRLPDGYESHVAERGATLFGGQKQRIAIARAILRDAPILILDEPTSGLDAVAESMVIDALERASAARTTFMIVHRLSTVRFANRILVFDKGRIVEQALTNNSSPATAATPASITCKQPHAEKHLLNYV